MAKSDDAKGKHEAADAKGADVDGSNSNATQELPENPNEVGDFNESANDEQDHTDFAMNERGLDREEEQGKFLGSQTHEGAPSPDPTDVGSVGEKLE